MLIQLGDIVINERHGKGVVISADMLQEQVKVYFPKENTYMWFYAVGGKSMFDDSEIKFIGHLDALRE